MSRPIPIGGRAGQKAAAFVSSGAPNAPFLGSLGSGPKVLEGALPELSLPDGTPEAFSMVRGIGAPCRIRGRPLRP